MEFPEQEEEMHISVHALAGQVSHQTIKIQGKVKNRMLTILIDTGSTHCFIDPEAAKLSGNIITPTAQMKVDVADGNKMHCDAKCATFQWGMQDLTYQHEVWLLPLGGCDMVLGVDWMRKHNPILFDFDKMQLTFKKNGKKVVVQGGEPKAASLKQMTSQALKRFIKKKQGVIGHLFAISAAPTEEVPVDPSITQLLNTYPDVFSTPTTLPPVRHQDHTIPLVPNAKPTNQRPYRVPYAQKVIEKLVKEMLDNGIITPSQSPFSSPVLLVKKKDGDWRFCVDYRKLNGLTIKNKFPIPVIEELLDELHGATIFSKIDLRAGYHQIRVNPTDSYKTAFKTHHGHFEFLVMPFGLTNAPATFQALMNNVFGDYLRKFVLVFFDDILIYSPDLATHLQHLNLVLSLLRQHQLYAKASKCSFGQPKVDYLGHIISGEGVSVDPSKIQCMKDWPQPKNIKGLRGFLGLTGYYRKFVRNYGHICKPLIDLLRKNSFQWSLAAEHAFQTLKQAMITTPVLALPDFTKTFEIEADACDTGIGAVLMQQGRALAFFNKALGQQYMGLSTYEK